MPPLTPSGGRRNGRIPVRKPATARTSPDLLDAERRRYEKDLLELRKQEAELKALEEKKRREMEELPKKLEARRIKQQEMTALRAALTATDDVFGPARIRRSATRKTGKSGRMTRPEERSARTQFLLLCGVLAVLLFLLWKSLP